MAEYIVFIGNDRYLWVNIICKCGGRTRESLNTLSRIPDHIPATCCKCPGKGTRERPNAPSGIPDPTPATCSTWNNCLKHTERTSGVTRVGDTRGGNWGCHPLEGVTRGGPPSHPPSDATGENNGKSWFTHWRSLRGVRPFCALPVRTLVHSAAPARTPGRWMDCPECAGYRALSISPSLLVDTYRNTSNKRQVSNFQLMPGLQ